MEMVGGGWILTYFEGRTTNFVTGLEVGGRQKGQSWEFQVKPLGKTQFEVNVPVKLNNYCGHKWNNDSTIHISRRQFR